MSAGKVVILEENGQELELTYAQFTQHRDANRYNRGRILENERPVPR
jgi:hypothetical protein